MKILFVMLTLLMPSMSLASQVVWFTQATSSHVNSAGTALDESYVFELGAFNQGFVPRVSNTSEWAAQWHPADRSVYRTDTQAFGGTFTAQVNEGPFQTSARGYIWGYSKSAPNEWILISDPDWKWPDASDQLAFPQQWSVSSARDIVVGQVDATESMGFFLKMGTVIQGILPAITAEEWRLAFFSPSELDTPAISDWLSDPDEDGLSNLLELAYSSDPLSAEGNSLPTVTAVEIDGLTFLQLAFEKSPTAPIDYKVEVSFDQRNWNSGEFFTEVVTETPTHLVVRSSVAMHLLDQQFMRLTTTLQ